jgi:hypothetical protein
MAVVLVLALALLFTPSVGAERERDVRLIVHLSIDQDASLSASQLTQIIDQIGQIWRAAGVDLTSGRYGEPSPPGAATVSLRVLWMGPRARTGEASALAWVGGTTSGRPTPVLSVSRSSVTELLDSSDRLGRPLSKWPRATREELIAQAIGRAAAHELGHYLLQSARHSDIGLMRPRFSPEELLGPSLAPFRVTADQATAVQRGAAKLAKLQLASGQ